MATPVVDLREAPGGLFGMAEWLRIALDLHRVVVEAYPSPLWQQKVKRETLQWANEHFEYTERQKRIARHKALQKLTYDDRLALGLENLKD